MIHELAFLPNRFKKDIKLPKVVFEPEADQNYGGYYEHNSGILVVVESDYVESTLLHEFIHYKQEVEGRLVPNEYSWTASLDEYDIAIQKYFTINPCEAEALYYEYKYTPNWYNEYWIKYCLNNEFPL